MLTKRTRTTLLLTFAAIVVLVWGENTWAKKPGSDPPELPNVRYTIHRIPMPDGALGGGIGISDNSGMVYGRYALHYNVNGSHAFLYDLATTAFYDLNLLAPFFRVPESLPADWWTNWQLVTASGINDLGDVVGNVEDASGVVRGYVLETGFDPDPASWDFNLLPLQELGSDQIEARRINIQGDILGRYIRPDGTIDVYLYNPWTDEHPLQFGINLKAAWSEFNNYKQVGGTLASGAAFYDEDPRPGMPSLQILDDRIRRVRRISDGGVLCGDARMQINGRGPIRTVAYRYDTKLPTAQLEPIMEGFAYDINSNNDLIVNDGTGEKSYLVHTGSASDEEHIWNVGDLISETDPEKAFWIDGHTIWGLTERDHTGFSQLAGGFKEPQPDGSTRSVKVVLTPFIPDPPQ